MIDNSEQNWKNTHPCFDGTYIPVRAEGHKQKQVNWTACPKVIRTMEKTKLVNEEREVYREEKDSEMSMYLVHAGNAGVARW